VGVGGHPIIVTVAITSQASSATIRCIWSAQLRQSHFMLQTGPPESVYGSA